MTKPEAKLPQEPPAQEIKEPGAEVSPEAPAADPQAEQIRKLEEEVARLKDQYLRAMAETENVRARARRDTEETARYAASKFARDMVNIVENLQRASTSISQEARAESDVLKKVGEGIDMTMQELLGVFERHGIRRVSPAGEKFDHNLHQAVSQVPDSGQPPGTVIDVLQAGYVLHDRLLRPAMVTVAAVAPGTGDKT